MNTTAIPSVKPVEKIPFYYSPYFIGLTILVIIFILYWNGFFVQKKKVETAKSKSIENEESEDFVASGGRSDSNGIDSGLVDRIHAINTSQQAYVNKSKTTYKYDAREDAVPAIYSPEEQLQHDLYEGHHGTD